MVRTWWVIGAGLAVIVGINACGGRVTDDDAEVGLAEGIESAGTGAKGGDEASFDCASFLVDVGLPDGPAIDCACTECGALIEDCAPDSCVVTCTASYPSYCPEQPGLEANQCVAAACGDLFE